MKTHSTVSAFFRFLCVMTLLIVGAEALAADNIVIIVNKKSNVTHLNEAQAKAIFLGETRFAASGVIVTVNERERSSEIYKDFYFSLASMSPKDVSVHWARKVFTGDAPPPVRLQGDDAAAIALIKGSSDAITYIYEKNLNSSVKSVYVLPSK